MQSKEQPAVSKSKSTKEAETSWIAGSLRTVALLWWAGLKDGLCFHRCMVYFVYDPQILIKTGQCLALNGVIFLGSILLWNFGLSPGAKWLLQVSLHGQERAALVDVAHTVICTAFGLVWLLPVYCLSFSLSCVWYQDIAKLALSVRHKKACEAAGGQRKTKQSSQQQDVMVQVAQELYRVVLFAVFLAQTFIAGSLPKLGWVANFVLLSFLNAFYSFDYKWSLSRKSLEERIRFFEWHWAYFAGFGSVCTLATVPWPFFVSAALVALLYPFFILVAADAGPEPAYMQVLHDKRAFGKEHRIQLPIFHTAIAMTSWIINRGPEVLSLQKHFRQMSVRGVLLCMAAAAAGWMFLSAWQNKGTSQKLL